MGKYRRTFEILARILHIYLTSPPQFMFIMSKMLHIPVK